MKSIKVVVNFKFLGRHFFKRFIYQKKKQSKTLEKLHYVKINDSSLGLSMIVPENTVFDKPQNGEKIENPLMPDGRPYLRLDWQGMKVEIDIFKASFDFFQVDC